MCISRTMWEVQVADTDLDKHVGGKCLQLRLLELKILELEVKLGTIRHCREGERLLEQGLQRIVTPLR